MENKHLFTIKEFAQLHHLNKRTLHYYDEIQLFSPKIKKANGYRYYTPEQSGELEYRIEAVGLVVTGTEVLFSESR